MEEKVVRLSAAETAKVIRKILKANFPGSKFSVRSDTYSMGSSVDISWTDGPASKSVEDKVCFLAGSGFDASIDLKYGKSHWMLPDGQIILAQSEGSERSRGYDPRIAIPKPHPDAKLVNFADHISCQRRFSGAFLQQAVDKLKERFGDAPEVRFYQGSQEAYLHTNDYQVMSRYMREIQNMGA